MVTQLHSVESNPDISKLYACPLQDHILETSWGEFTLRSKQAKAPFAIQSQPSSFPVAQSPESN